MPSRAATAIPHVWKTARIGGGGYVTGIVFGAAKGVKYLRTDVGGAYRWDDTAQEWIRMTTFVGHDNAQFDQVEAIAADPTDPSRVYFASGQDLWSGAPRAFFRSVDGGRSFETFTPPFEMGGNWGGRGNGERLQVDPNSPNILFMGSRAKGLFRSVDRGATWTATTFPVTTTANNVGVNAVLLDRKSGKAGKATPRLFVSASVPGAAGTPNLWWSQDTGATFAALPGQPQNGHYPHRMALSGDSTLYVTYAADAGPGGDCYKGGSLWKFSLATRTWTDLTPASYSVGFGGIAVDPTNPKTLMLTTTGWYPDQVLRSLDGGATWKNVGQAGTNGTVLDASASPWYSWHSSTPGIGHWVDQVEIDPFDPDRATVIEGGGIWTSVNLTKSDAGTGASWFHDVKGVEEMGGWGTGRSLVVPPSGPLLHAVFGDIGGMRFTDLTVSPPDSQHYDPIGGSNTSISIAWRSPNVVARTNYLGNRGAVSLDAGRTWKEFGVLPAELATSAAGDPGYLAVSALGRHLVWQPKGGAVWHSGDTGKTWTKSVGYPVADAAWNRFIPTADKVDDALFFLSDARNGNVYRSVDGGLNWSVVATSAKPSDPGGWAMQSVPDSNGHLWLPAGTTGLQYSFDKGATWQTVTGLQACEQIGFGKAEKAGGYPTLFAYAKADNAWGILRSTDRGATWARINDSLTQYGWVSAVSGDMRTFGRAYFVSWGLHYADPAGGSTGVARPATGTHAPAILRRGDLLTSPSPLKLHDLSGRLLRTGTRSGAEFVLSLEALPTGSYLARDNRGAMTVSVMR